MNITNNDRANAGYTALTEEYAEHAPFNMPEALTETLRNILHYCKDARLDFGHAVEVARQRCEDDYTREELVRFAEATTPPEAAPGADTRYGFQLVLNLYLAEPEPDGFKDTDDPSEDWCLCGEGTMGDCVNLACSQGDFDDPRDFTDGGDF